MAKDIDDIEYERMVARICGRPEPPPLIIEGATLLAAKPRKNGPIVHLDAYRMPDPSRRKGNDKGDER